MTWVGLKSQIRCTAGASDCWQRKTPSLAAANGSTKVVGITPSVPHPRNLT